MKKGNVGSFEDLDVFRRAYRASLDIHRASLGFPAIEQYALGDQVRRASKSICANIAEGFGKQRPVAPNALADGKDNPAGRALNRRVEAVVQELRRMGHTPQVLS